MRFFWQTLIVALLWAPPALAQPTEPTPAKPLTLVTPTLTAPQTQTWFPNPRLLLIPKTEQLLLYEAQAPGGFISLRIPDTLTPVSIAQGLGLFAGKMLLLKSLCEWGNCRVNTGPGDLSAGWVEQMSGLDPLPAGLGGSSTKLRGIYND